MKTLMQEINNLLEAKNTDITVLRWERDNLREENEKLKKENAELKNDIEKYKENEANRV